MTKNEERTLLSKIDELLSQAEPNGYIDLAFRGCVRMASDNIDNDWGCSPMDYVNRIDKMSNEMESIKTQNKSLTEDLQTYYDKWKESEQQNTTMLANAEKLCNTLDERNIEIEKLKTEVMKLKARLFDLLDV